MTNGEIRARAKEMRKSVRGLVPIVFAMAAFTVANLFAGIWADSLDPYAGTALYALFLAVYGLIAGAGVAAVGCAAWSTGRARFLDLFAPLSDARRFARAMAVVLAVVALSLFQNYTAGLASEDLTVRTFFLRLLGTVVVPLASSVVATLYYALALWPDAALSRVFGRGLKLSLAAFWRFFGMSVTVLFLPLIGICCLAVAFMVVARLDAPSIVALVILGAALAGFSVFVAWRVMPYYYLAYAGLADEVFCAPEAPAEK